jgi:hypothetical protein
MMDGHTAAVGVSPKRQRSLVLVVDPRIRRDDSDLPVVVHVIDHRAGHFRAEIRRRHAVTPRLPRHRWSLHESQRAVAQIQEDPEGLTGYDDTRHWGSCRKAMLDRRPRRLRGSRERVDSVELRQRRDASGPRRCRVDCRPIAALLGTLAGVPTDRRAVLVTLTE